MFLRSLYFLQNSQAELPPYLAEDTWAVLHEQELQELRYWVVHICDNKKPIHVRYYGVGMHVDASEIGYGAWWALAETSGLFSLAETTFSSTHREMLGMLYGFMDLAPNMLGEVMKPVASHKSCTLQVLNIIPLLVFTDNQNVASIMKWGSRLEHLNNLAKMLWSVADRVGFKWWVKWVPREQNTRADKLSKIPRCIIVLNPSAVQYLISMKKCDRHSCFCRQSLCYTTSKCSGPN